MQEEEEVNISVIRIFHDQWINEYFRVHHNLHLQTAKIMQQCMTYSSASYLTALTVTK